MTNSENHVMAQSTRLADVVYDRLCASVIDGTLEPGQRVRDGELAEELGVSRMPVREALQRLERQGLIQMVASRYTKVTPVTPDMPGKSLEFLGYQMGIGLRLAVPHMDDEQRAHAASLARDVAKLVKTDPKDAYRANRELSMFLGEASGNTVYAATLGDIWLHLTRNLRGTFPLVKDADELSSDYEALAVDIENGDGVAAETQIRHVFLLGAGEPGPAAAVADLWSDAAA